MGGCLRKNPPRIAVTEAVPPDTPLRIRVKLRGELDEATTKNITQRLCEMTDESERRFEAAAAESDNSYFVTVNPLDGDDPGTPRRLSKKIVNLITGKGIPVTENVKMVGAKEYLLAGEL